MFDSGGERGRDLMMKNKLLFLVKRNVKVKMSKIAPNPLMGKKI